MHHLILLFDCETASLLNQKVYPEIKHTEDTIFFQFSGNNNIGHLKE